MIQYKSAKARCRDEKKTIESVNNMKLAIVAIIAAVATLALTIYLCFFK